MNLDKQVNRVKKGHVSMMRHPETALYSGVFMMGKSEVVEGSFTAYTDGVNKRYCANFMEGKPEPELRGIILHENLHVILKHIVHGKDMFLEDNQLANVAADIAVHDVIDNIRGCISGTSERVVVVPEDGIYDPFFHNWSMREIYKHLKKENPNRNKNKDGSEDSQNSDPSERGKQSNGSSKIIVNGKEHYISDNSDEHDISNMDDLTHEEIKEINDKIDKALREGGILAGRMGAKMPRVIGDLLTPKVDWREMLRDFVSASMRGNDEYTWRKMNKRHMANNIYTPSVENETIGELVVAIDTSGSIGSEELAKFASELQSICEVSNPERVRVLWWDTQVHGEQIFENDYNNIGGMLKPLGGGGTHVSCVSKYINKERISAECVIVFTDGHVEGNVDWNISSPTLWMITDNKSFEPPCGKKVMVNDE